MNGSMERPVSIDSSDSQKIKLVFGHADSGKLVSTIEGTSLPIPETGESVQFGEIDPGRTQDQEATFGEQTYTVTERNYHYFIIDTETVNGREDPAYLATVVVSVLPEGEDSNQQAAR